MSFLKRIRRTAQPPKHTFEFSAIAFREDSEKGCEWTALALEMNVRGYGPDHDTALRDLIGMVAAQISFAMQQGNPESVWHPAEASYWAMFKEARKNRFIADVSGSEAPKDRIADIVPLSLLAVKGEPKWATAGA